MINSEKNIYLQETEIKPNKYALIVLLASMGGILISWILNEIGIFRVGDLEMRVGSLISFIFVAVPAVTFLINKNSMGNPKMKYVIMTSFTVFTLANTVLMTFHTTVLLIFPISIAMLYRSKTLGIYALSSSLFCSIFSPVLGYLLGTWDLDFFKELLLIATNGTVELVGATYTLNMTSIYKILLYISFPRFMLVGAYSLLMFYVIGLGVDHVNNQIALNNISHKDTLTGLYNQSYYKEVIVSNDTIGDVAIVFFDVNDLKKLNDMYGHEQGDLLLKRSAESIIRVCDDERIVGFRVGGDEFLIIMEGADENEVKLLIDKWRTALDEINQENRELYEGLVCSMAYGYAIGKFKNILELVTEADNYMYSYKKKFKEEAGNAAEK